MEAKKIIITGGATRIGAAIAKSLVNYDVKMVIHFNKSKSCLLYTSPSPRDAHESRMPSSA